MPNYLSTDQARAREGAWRDSLDEATALIEAGSDATFGLSVTRSSARYGATSMRFATRHGWPRRR